MPGASQRQPANPLCNRFAFCAYRHNRARGGSGCCSSVAVATFSNVWGHAVLLDYTASKIRLPIRRVSGPEDGGGPHAFAPRRARAHCPPLAALIANSSGKPSTTRTEHVVRGLEGRVAIVLDGGAGSLGVGSTVVDGLHPDGAIRVLQPSGVTVEDLERVIREELGEEEREAVPRVLVHRCDYADEVIESTPTTPGMKYLHFFDHHFLLADKDPPSLRSRFRIKTREADLPETQRELVVSEIAQFRERAAKKEREKVKELEIQTRSQIAASAAPAAPNRWGGGSSGGAGGAQAGQRGSDPEPGSRAFGGDAQGYGKPVEFVKGASSAGTPTQTDEQMEAGRKEARRKEEELSSRDQDRRYEPRERQRLAALERAITRDRATKSSHAQVKSDMLKPQKVRDDATDRADEEREKSELEQASEMFLQQQMDGLRRSEEARKAGMLVDSGGPVKLNTSFAAAAPTTKAVASGDALGFDLDEPPDARCPPVLSSRVGLVSINARRGAASCHGPAHARGCPVDAGRQGQYRGLGLAGGLHVAVGLGCVQLGVPLDQTPNQGSHSTLDFKDVRELSATHVLRAVFSTFQQTSAMPLLMKIARQRARSHNQVSWDAGLHCLVFTKPVVPQVNVCSTTGPAAPDSVDRSLAYIYAEAIFGVGLVNAELSVEHLYTGKIMNMMSTDAEQVSTMISRQRDDGHRLAPRFHRSDDSARILLKTGPRRVRQLLVDRDRRDSLLVGGSYLVYTATISGSTLGLVGDLNATVPLTVFGALGVKHVTWNGAAVHTTSASAGSFAGSLAPRSAATKIKIPKLAGWKYADLQPEIKSAFNDARVSY
ncbi:unnamed protein product [Mycena citricolor]|uniref:Beta-galactosidase domain-containing protein n=1 Tax=Mycena citricolor TaxID=2018698 RepID=A0AAD2H9X6_9AGAR|nr:unnamed protein product [Mycena citricolor]